jgi:hypothetical protein
LVLGLLILKPQIAFLVPPALLLAGYRRVFVGWAIATVALGGAALAAAGPSLFSQAGKSLELIHGVPGPVQLSLERQLPLPIAIVGIVFVLLVTAAVILRTRGGGPAMPIAASLIAGILVSPYINFYDLSAVVLAGWLLVRMRPLLAQSAVLLGVYVAVYLAPIWPLVTITALCLWLMSLLTPWGVADAIDQPLTQAGSAAA